MRVPRLALEKQFISRGPCHSTDFGVKYIKPQLHMYKAICMAYNLELHLELVGTHLEWIGEKEPIIRRLPCTYRLHIYI